MVHDLFVVHDGLAAAARFPSLSRHPRRISVLEVALLLGCGAAAAALSGFVKLRLGIPGHSIVLAALPMALGLSLAPRRGAGALVSAGALGSASMLAFAGASFGSGSFASLTLLGPMMDLALRGVNSGGFRVYGALVLSGVITNLLALASRAGSKLLGLDVGGRPFDGWWLQAMVTYTLAGLIAGLLGAVCWFHVRRRSPDRQQQP